MIKFLANSFSLSAGALIGNQIGLRVGCQLQPRPMPHQFAAALEHPLRLRYRNPADEVGAYGAGPGLTVLDLGCGSGLYTQALAERVGETGLVHAVDLQAPMRDRAQARIEAAGFSERVRFHAAGAYQLPLEDDSIDLAILVATLPQIPNKLLALAEISRVLKHNGRLVVSEEMPDPAYVPPFVTRRWLDYAGFTVGGQSGGWFCYHVIAFNDKLLGSRGAGEIAG